MEYEYEEEWRGTKMEDGEDVKNQQQLFVAKMTEDNFKKKNKKGLEEKQKEISIAKMGEKRKQTSVWNKIWTK